jgi:hypothetical protein
MGLNRPFGQAYDLIDTRVVAPDHRDAELQAGAGIAAFRPVRRSRFARDHPLVFGLWFITPTEDQRR